MDQIPKGMEICPAATEARLPQGASPRHPQGIPQRPPRLAELESQAKRPLSPYQLWERLRTECFNFVHDSLRKEAEAVERDCERLLDSWSRLKGQSRPEPELPDLGNDEWWLSSAQVARLLVLRMASGLPNVSDRGDVFRTGCRLALYIARLTELDSEAL